MAEAEFDSSEDAVRKLFEEQKEGFSPEATASIAREQAIKDAENQPASPKRPLTSTEQDQRKQMQLDMSEALDLGDIDLAVGIGRLIDELDGTVPGLAQVTEAGVSLDENQAAMAEDAAASAEAQKSFQAEQTIANLTRVPIGSDGKYEANLTSGSAGEFLIKKFMAEALVQTTLEDWLVEMSNLPEVAGAIAGAEIGAEVPGGPIVKAGGIMVGGALGAAIGSLAADSANNYDDPDNVLRAFEAGKVDAAFTLGGRVIGKAVNVLGDVASNVLGLNAAGVEAFLRASDKYRVKVGVFDVSSYGFFRQAGKVAGVFPLLSGPFRKSRVKAVDRLMGDLELSRTGLETSAPAAAVGDLGVDMVKAATKVFREWKDQAGRLYAKADQTAIALGAHVDSQDLRLAARTISPPGVVPRTTDGSKAFDPSPESNALTAEVNRIVDAMSNIKNNTITLQELRGIQRDINAAMKKDPNDLDAGILTTLKIATENAMASIHVPSPIPKFLEGPAIAQSLKTLYSDANAYFAQGMVAMESPAGQTFLQVDKNFWRAGIVRPGTINADQIAAQLMKFDSPQTVRDLQVLLGEDVVSAAARQHIDSAIQSNVENMRTFIRGPIVRFNFKGLLRDLGEGPGSTVNPDALQIATKSEVPLNDIRDLIKFMEGLGQVGDTSTFLARRAILGGGTAVIAALTAQGFAGNEGLAATLTAFAFIRGGAAMLSSPSVVRGILVIRTPGIEKDLRNAHMLRVINTVMLANPPTQTEVLNARITGFEAPTFPPDVANSTEAEMLGLPSQESIGHLKFSEGFRAVQYNDKFGNPTIGYGTNLIEAGFEDQVEPGNRPFPGMKVDEAQAEAMMRTGVKVASQGVTELLRAREVVGLDLTRQEVLTEMVYNMGRTNASTFSTMFHELREAVGTGDYSGAAAAMLTNVDGTAPSKWWFDVSGKVAEIQARQDPQAALDQALKMQGSNRVERLARVMVQGDWSAASQGGQVAQAQQTNSQAG